MNFSNQILYEVFSLLLKNLLFEMSDEDKTIEFALKSFFNQKVDKLPFADFQNCFPSEYR